MSYRRVTITVPADVLKAADALARRLDRSRSWVVAEALRRYSAGGAARRGGAGPSDTRSSSAGREPSAPPYHVQRAFREAELSRLRGDLAMTPEQRVRVAEELVRTVPAERRRPRYRRVLQFDSYDDYLDWKTFADIGL